MFWPLDVDKHKSSIILYISLKAVNLFSVNFNHSNSNVTSSQLFDNCLTSSRTSVFFLSGILGYDIFLDKNGDVQHNLTVMDFNENYGMVDPLSLKLFSSHEICPNYFTPSISLKKPGRLSQPSLSHDAGALLRFVDWPKVEQVCPKIAIMKKRLPWDSHFTHCKQKNELFNLLLGARVSTVSIHRNLNRSKK